MNDLPAFIVFSHLRWDFVYQRPQHLISRFAKTRRVLFVEEPAGAVDGSTPTMERRTEADGLTVCRPHTGIPNPGFCDSQTGAIAQLVAELLKNEGIADYVLWFYSPMALGCAEGLNPQAVIYDCMDELSAFANAPASLLEREAELLQRADVVFTGGPSLYRAKKGRHPNVYCFPSSVDAIHFGRASHGAEPADQSAIPHPRLGFFGVIDERLDVQLLDGLAQCRPDWHFVMVGPVVKIDPATLPKHDNIHYLGQKSYHDLPDLIAGWDVCLLPFARNEATRFISPTKTLEYMAAERMIVSTPIADVAEPYSGIVYLGDTVESFGGACEQALTANPHERRRLFRKMREVLSATSWDSTAAKMASIVDGIVNKGKAGDGDDDTRSYASQNGKPPSRRDHPNRVPVAAQERGVEATALQEVAPTKRRRGPWPAIVIGAGPTGLSATYHLGDDALLLEANDRVGGWCRSMISNGFTFDYAGHIMFSNDPYVHEMYEVLLGDNIHWQDREAWIYSKEVYTRYPFQGSLHGLPPDVIKDCIVGAVEARYGSAKKIGSNGFTNGHANGKLEQNGRNGHSNGVIANGGLAQSKPLEDCCGDGVLESTAALSAPQRATSAGRAPANFEEFIYQTWGRGIAEHFAIPYNRKLWAVPLYEMETSWLGGRVPMPDLEEMVEGALKPAAKPMGPNARFGYPLEGGFQALMNGFLPHVQKSLRLNTRVQSISPGQHVVTLRDGTELGYDSLISTMPLPVLVRACGLEAPPEVQAAARGLRNVSVRCIHLGIGRQNLTEKHWIYYPEDTVFHRIFVQGNASPHCNPRGGFGLTCEITYSIHKPLPCEGDELIERCIDDCIKVGIINCDDDVWAAEECDLPYAYVVYDHARPKNVAVIRAWLAKHRIILAGRYSEWEYYNSDHAFLAGKRAADEARGMQISAAAAFARPIP